MYDAGNPKGDFGSRLKRIYVYIRLIPEKEMAPRSSTLAWKMPWMEEPGRLQSVGLLRVGHDWVTSLSLFTFMHWRRKWQPAPGFLPGESQGPGAWWAAVYGVAQSRTRLKRLSRSSSSMADSCCTAEASTFKAVILQFLKKRMCNREATVSVQIFHSSVRGREGPFKVSGCVLSHSVLSDSLRPHGL